MEKIGTEEIREGREGSNERVQEETTGIGEHLVGDVGNYCWNPKEDWEKGCTSQRD